MSKSTTFIRHQAIYNRFCTLVNEARKGGIYQHIYLMSIYLQIAEELGYTEKYVGRIVVRFQKRDEA